MSLGDATADLRGGVSIDHGIVDSISNGVVTVNFGGDVKPECLSLVGFTPLVGDSVVVMRANGRAYILGSPSRNPSPVTVKVTATSVTGKPGLLAAVDDSGTGYELPYMSTYTPAVNDVVQVLWQSPSGLVLGKRGAQSGGESGGGGSTPGAPQNGTSTFPAIDAGSFRGGKWRTDTDNVAQGDYGGWGLNNGAWFYGGAPHQALNGASVLSAAIWLPRLRGGDFAPQTVHLYRHSSNVRPGGDVTRVAGPYDVTSPGVGASGWVGISPDLAWDLITHDGGIGISGMPYVVLAGRSTDAMTGALRISWHK